MVWTPNRILAMAVGVIFLLVGLAGLFFNPSGLNMHGWNLLGFDVDIVHNIIHLATGILGIAAITTNLCFYSLILYHYL